ncbi:hypothetical protein J6590_108175 [Homalodisca vitripennis]|nr:hypothetical protein J6590_108175 [Homalodisca vitripennis]
MASAITLLKSETEKIEEERNQKILELIQNAEANFKNLRKNLYNLLDDKFKPELVEIQFKNGKSTVHTLNNEESDSFTFDTEDEEKISDIVKKIINSTIDVDELQNISGGRLYKYRFRPKYGCGIRENLKY